MRGSLHELTQLSYHYSSLVVHQTTDADGTISPLTLSLQKAHLEGRI